MFVSLTCFCIYLAFHILARPLLGGYQLIKNFYYTKSNYPLFYTFRSFHMKSKKAVSQRSFSAIFNRVILFSSFSRMLNLNKMAWKNQSHPLRHIDCVGGLQLKKVSKQLGPRLSIGKWVASFQVSHRGYFGLLQWEFSTKWLGNFNHIHYVI